MFYSIEQTIKPFVVESKVSQQEVIQEQLLCFLKFLLSFRSFRNFREFTMSFQFYLIEILTFQHKEVF